MTSTLKKVAKKMQRDNLTASMARQTNFEIIIKKNTDSQKTILVSKFYCLCVCTADLGLLNQESIENKLAKTEQ